MPVIPFTQESQRLDPSSPVPAITPEKADMQGEATVNLGKAIFNLGDALDTISKRTQNEDDKLSVQIAANKARIVAEKQRMHFAGQMPNTDDPDGTKAIDQYNSATSDSFSAIRDSLPDRLKKAFDAHATDILADNTLKVSAVEVKKRTDIIGAKIGENTNTLGQMAALNPQNLDQALLLHEHAIMDSAELNPVQKTDMIRKGKQQILQQTIQQMTNDKAYGSAEVLLRNPKYDTIFDGKDREKMIDDMHKEEYQTYQRENARLSLQEQKAHKDMQFRETQILSEKFAALQAAGNSDSLRGPIIQTLQQEVLKGNVSPEKARTLEQSGFFKDKADDNYEANMMAKIVKGQMGITKAIDKVLKDRGLEANGVSYDRAQKIISNLNMMNERQKQDPNYAQMTQAGEDMIRSLGKEDITATMNDLQKRQLEIKIQESVGAYRQRVLNGHPANPMAVASDIMKKRLNFDTGTIAPLRPGGIMNGLDEMNAPAIQKKIDETKRKGLELYNSGKLSPTQQKEYINEHIRLTKKLKDLQSDIYAKPAGPAIEGPTTKARGR